MTDHLPFHPDSDDQRLLAQVLDYYHGTLQQTPEALDFLRTQGITHSQAVEQFRIGYADRSLGKLLPSKETKAGRSIRRRLEQLGIFRASSGHEHFNGCVVFPVLAGDGTGRIVDVYGKKTLGTQLRKGTALDLYLADERHGVWNIEAFGTTDEIIVCSSVFDALAFWCLGFRNVTCTVGPAALTDDHLAAFSEFKVRRVLLAHAELAPRLLEAGCDCFHLRLPAHLSMAAFLAHEADPGEALSALIRKAEWLGNGQPTAKPTTTPVSIETAAPAEAEPDPLPSEPAEADLPNRTDSPVPATPDDIVAEVNEDEVLLNLGDRRYRVRGWQKNLSIDCLRVNLLASNGNGLFVDTFDLYSAKHRRSFVTQAAGELEVEEQTIKKDLGRVLLKLEELQDQHISQALLPRVPTPNLTEAEKAEALRLLRDPALLDRIVADFSIVGEPTNKLVGYLAAVSRKLDEPLAIIIQSSSAAGKTSLMDAVLAFVPPEDLVKYSAMTGQSLFYMGETDLKHKILAIVEEEGAEQASYALKLLQSEGELTIASTGKEAKTGRLTTQEYRVQGPVMIFLTTTSVQVDEELLNRCLVLTVDENREQTKAIHQAQRRKQTLDGLLAQQDQQQTLAVHRNAQRLLRPLLVANPYAEHLTFLDDKTRTRRDHAKYLTLIRSITLLHQYQRPVRTVEHQGQPVEYIEVALEDIEQANQLAHEALGRSLDDLPPQTRRLLDLVDEMVTVACQQQGVDRSDYRFTRRDVREYSHWGHTQLKVHLKRLEDLEYLLVHRGGRGQLFVYELLYEKPASDQQRFLARLIDVAELRRQKSGPNGSLSANGLGQVGGKAVASQAVVLDATLESADALPTSKAEICETVNSTPEINEPS
ncbi:MAG: DNA primase [Planctomycetia bacterium]|nr:DNA primase [Planctomycetia bacterium]